MNRFPVQPAGPPLAGDLAHMAAVSAAAFTPPATASYPVGAFLLSLVSNLENFEAGWARCIGQQLLGTTYPDLADRLGTGPGSYWGAAAVGFVKIPDLSDRFPLIEGSTFHTRDTGGEVNHLLSVAEMPSHTHSLGLQSTSQAGSPTFGSPVIATFAGRVIVSYGGSGSVAQSDPNGGSTAHNNMPPYICLQGYVRVLP